MFVVTKPLHENAGPIGKSFEQTGAVMIGRLSTAFKNFNSRNRPGMTKLIDLFFA